MAQRIQLRRGTASEWAAANPVLANGEPGVENPGGKQKLGDGVTAWNDLPYASKGDQGPAGIADDASVAQQVTSGPETVAALSATITTATAPKLDKAEAATSYEPKGSSALALAPLLLKIAANISDTNLLILGDSTTAKSGTLDQTGVQWDTWGERFPAALAARYPNNKISTRWYNDTSSAYDAAEILNPGGTAKTINVWMGAVAGKSTTNAVSKYSTLVAGIQPDLLIVAHGHNESNTTLDRMRNLYVANVETLRGIAGGCPTVLMSQNPAPAYIPGVSEARADMYRAIATERGYGYIDVCGAFYRDGRDITSVLVMGAAQDGVGLHPSNEGSIVWLNEVMKHFGNTNSTTQALRHAQPAFWEHRANFLANGDLSSFASPPTLPSWTPTNVTASSQTGTASLLESKAYSVKLTKTAAGSSAKLAQSNSTQAKMLAGRWVTFAVRMYIPSTTAQTAGQLSVSDGYSALAFTDQSRVVYDQWHWRIVTTLIDPRSTIVTCNIQVDPNGTGNTEVMYIDRATLVLGKYPADAY